MAAARRWRRRRRGPQQDQRGHRATLAGRRPAGGRGGAVLVGPQVERVCVRARRRAALPRRASALGAPTFLQPIPRHAAADGEAAGWAEVRERRRRLDRPGTARCCWSPPIRTVRRCPTRATTMPPRRFPPGCARWASSRSATSSGPRRPRRSRRSSTGVAVKIISGDDPETVAALARQAGLGPEIPLLSGLELEQLDGDALISGRVGHGLFGRITPAAEGAPRGRAPGRRPLRGDDR